ncbi:hypothetical protein ACIHDR_40305 [Nocardia sp. NPDC052278]
MLQTSAIVTAVEPGPALAARLHRRWREGTRTPTSQLGIGAL